MAIHNCTDTFDAVLVIKNIQNRIEIINRLIAGQRVCWKAGTPRDDTYEPNKRRFSAATTSINDIKIFQKQFRRPRKLLTHVMESPDDMICHT